jgi:hypothetical protein
MSISAPSRVEGTIWAGPGSLYTKTDDELYFQDGAGTEHTVLVDGTWSNFTPTWTSTGTAPAIGNGTLAGRYTQIGKTVHAHIRMTCGSTTTYGTGEYSWALPVTANQVGHAGSVWGVETGVAYRVGAAKIETTTTVRAQSEGLGNFWGQTTPHTWGDTDDMAIALTYEAA